MRGIIYKDICLFFRCLDLRFFLVAAVAMAILLFQSGVYSGMLASIMLAMTVGLQNVLVFEKEEKAEWGKFQRILPVGGSTVVAGKYASVLLTALISLAGCLVLNLAVFAVYRTFLLPVLGLSALLAAAIPVGWAAVSLPFCYCIGFQAAQYSSVALMFPLFFFLKNFEDGKWAVSDLLPAAGNLYVLLLLGLLALAGIFLLSLAVSAAGYCRRGGRRRARNPL